jgi:hypothetical protein
MEPGDWQQRLAECQVIVNLTGKNIFCRWTAHNKKLIHDSRIYSTRHIVQALPRNPEKTVTLINASAAGYYGFGADESKNEDEKPGTDFLARVCVDWEKEATRAEERGIRVVITRFGVVLGAGGGALAKMLPAFKLGVAGKLGTGRQWFSWIHMEDLTRAFLFLIEHEEFRGAVNLAAPNPVRNYEFTKTLGRIVRRPTILPIPTMVAKLVLGELSSVVLEGNRTIPARLKKSGFDFQYPDLEEALTEIAGRPD